MIIVFMFLTCMVCSMFQLFFLFEFICVGLCTCMYVCVWCECGCICACVHFYVWLHGNAGAFVHVYTLICLHILYVVARMCLHLCMPIFDKSQKLSGYFLSSFSTFLCVNCSFFISHFLAGKISILKLMMKNLLLYNLLPNHLLSWQNINFLSCWKGYG